LLEFQTVAVAATSERLKSRTARRDDCDIIAAAGRMGNSRNHACLMDEGDCLIIDELRLFL